MVWGFKIYGFMIVFSFSCCRFDDLCLSLAGSVSLSVCFQIAGKDLLEQCERTDQLMYGKYRSFVIHVLLCMIS